MHRPIASLLTVVSLSCVATVSAQPAPIFTSEDVLAVRTFAGGQGVAVSSTGRWVAYALTDANDEWNVQEPRPTSHVVVQTLGADRPGAPRALTTGVSHSSFPVWSPDGRRLAFIREDKFYGLDRNVQTADAVATFIRLPAQKYATPEQRVAFHTQLRDRLLAVPGITASTIASTPPFTFAGRRRLTAVDGRLASDPPPDVVTVVVEPAYFHTVVRGLVLGESFSELHGTPGHEAAIVNQRFAEVYLGAGSPIGRHLELRPPTAQRTYLREAEGPTPPVRVTIVGVSPDIRQSLGDAVPIVYLPYRAEAPAGVTLIVRGSGGSAHVVSAAREAANAIDPDLALGVVRTLDELRDRSRSPAAGSASQFAKIGGLALVLAGVGLYSAIAYAVRRRTQEIAIRMALGAQATHVRWLFLKTSAWVVLGGLAVGLPASLALGRQLQINVVLADSRDPVMLIAMVAVLAIVALVASIVPARRATRLEPTTALRIE